MRSAINENRTVQLALLGVLALLGGLLLLKTTGGSGSTSSAAQTTSSASPGASASGSTDSSGVAAIAAPVGTSSSSSSGSSQAAPPVPANLVPGPSLPKSLLASYQRNDAVALLVVRDGGTDDALVRASVKLLDRVPNLAVYVTKAKQIARYAWLTQGVNVTELPALLVLLPRKRSNGRPTASVTYGFIDGGSVLQAARDALYRGPTHLPYHP